MYSSEHLAEDEQPKGNGVPEERMDTPKDYVEQNASSYNEEAIRQGLIYPPPPDFYINMPVGSSSPPPVVPDSRINTAAFPPISKQQEQKLVSSSPENKIPELQSASNAHPSAASEIHSSVPSYSSYSATQLPQRTQMYPSYTPVKPSYTWIWLLITGLAILLFGSCALATWLGYSMFGSQVNNQYEANTIGLQTINNYYGAIQAKNYIQAYSYLRPEGSMQNLTQAQFLQNARQQDAHFGDVLNFSPGILTFPDNRNTFTLFKESVSVGRVKGQNYIVNLTFQKIGSTWYITNFDRI